MESPNDSILPLHFSSAITVCFLQSCKQVLRLGQLDIRGIRLDLHSLDLPILHHNYKSVGTLISEQSGSVEAQPNRLRELGQSVGDEVELCVGVELLENVLLPGIEDEDVVDGEDINFVALAGEVLVEDGEAGDMVGAGSCKRPSVMLGHRGLGATYE